MAFKENMIWGAATASYQIEGAWDAAGKGLSIWDAMTRRPGSIFNGDTGDTACDHYNRYEQDVELMESIGLQAYRFSISWPRVFPNGLPGSGGAANKEGLDFYDRLVDKLLEKKIQPWATLYHWDLPLELYYRGGWLNRDIANWFADYTEAVVGRLGDRVRNWLTLNEPNMFVSLGYGNGSHAPGYRLSDPDLVRIIHNVLNAHGKSTDVLRRHGGEDFTIGWAPALAIIKPADESDPELVEAAREASFSLPPNRPFSFSTSVWNDPVFLGRYPQEYLDRFQTHLPENWQDDMPAISQKLELCGLNVYLAAGEMYRREDGVIDFQESGTKVPGSPRTLFNWPVTPGALYWGPKFMSERYNIPIAITENGLSSLDWVHEDGSVKDPARIDFLSRYLKNLKRAAADGVDVQAYFQWSLMDNFEWAEGYKHRFGLVYVDFETLQRIPKDSASWYSGVIKSNGAQL